MKPDPRAIASAWLSSLSACFTSPSDEETTSAFASLFDLTGVLRDSLVFSWDVHSISGSPSILDHVRRGLQASDPASAAHGGLRDVKLDDRIEFSPKILVFDQPGAVEFAFTFRTTLGMGRGSARLFPSSESGSTADWRAGSAYLMLDAIQGHEEPGPELGVYENHTIHWKDVKEKRRKEVEDNLYVLIGMRLSFLKQT
jgi:hypothetical protein